MFASDKAEQIRIEEGMKYVQTACKVVFKYAVVSPDKHNKLQDNIGQVMGIAAKVEVRNKPYLAAQDGN